MKYRDKILLGGFKGLTVLSTDSVPSMIRQKFKDEPYKEVKNEITNLEYITMVGASSRGSTTVTVTLRGEIGGEVRDIYVSKNEFLGLIKEATLVGGKFDGSYVVLIDGYNSKIVKQTEENIKESELKEQQRELKKEESRKMILELSRKKREEVKDAGVGSLFKYKGIVYIYLGYYPFNAKSKTYNFIEVNEHSLDRKKVSKFNFKKEDQYNIERLTGLKMEIESLYEYSKKQLKKLQYDGYERRKWRLFGEEDLEEIVLALEKALEVQND